MTPPRSLRQFADGLRARHADLRARSVPLRGRADPALVAVLVAGIALLGLAGWTFARIEDARGFLDPPVVEEIDDPRILTDYRAPSAPIVDMVPHGFHAFAGRSDGTIHRYDMRTGLFSEEQLPGAPALAGPLSFLSSGCAAGVDCPAGDAMFAVTETGGLAARDADGWRTVISDSAWIGADGRPVDLPQVTLWALSDDGRWLLASAGAQGLGLFDQRGSVWVPVAQRGAVADPAHLHFAHDRFWLGGAGGLETIQPTRPMDRVPVTGVGAVLDLERTADGDLLILQAGACPGGTCLSIWQARGPTDLRRLVGETAISPGLSATALSHAAFQDGRAVVLGAAGVHAYDPKARGWTVLEPGAVDAFHAGPDGRSILVAAGAKVLRVSGGRIAWEAQTPDRVVQILPGPGDAVLALLRNGSVVDLSRPGPAVIVPTDIGPGDLAQVLAAATVGETVVLRRGADLILHDPAARRWSIATNQMPPASDPDTRLLGTDRALWLVDLRQGRVWEGTLQGDWPGRTVAFRDAATGLGRLVSAQADGVDLHLVRGDGAPLRLRSGGSDVVARVDDPAPSRFRPVTGAAAAGAMIFSDGQGIAAYNTAQRGWSEVWQGPPGGVRDLDIAPDTLLVLSPGGVLYRLQDDDWATVSGAQGGIALGSAQVTDALQADGSIFLGGAGRVVEYRPDARRSVRVFGNGGGAVRIAGVANGTPVWTSGGRLLRGDQMVSVPPEGVLWAGRSPDGFLYLAEENGRRHVVLPVQSRRCLFRGAAAPGGTPVDARALPDGRVFVATTAGLGIHEPQNRRWIRVASAGVSPDARLEIVAGHLVLLEQGGARVVPISSLPAPDSCDANPVQVLWSVLPPALQVVHDASADRLLLLGRDGDVQDWRGSLRRIVPPTGPAPSMAGLRRVRAVPGGLMFAAADRIWTYDTQARTWSSRPLERAPATVRTIDIADDAGTTRVTVWDDAGQGYGGEGQSGPITLRRLIGPTLPRPAQDPARILDMAQDDRVMAVLGDRVLELFERADPAPRTTLRLPQARQGWQILQAEGTQALVLADGPQDRPVRLSVLVPGPGTADLAQASFSYEPGDDRDWRLSNDALWRIDRGLVLHRCAIAKGKAAPDDCEAQTKPPDLLDPASLIAATTLPAGDRLVLSGGAVLWIGADWRISGRTEIPGATAQSVFVEDRRARFLWTGQGGALWRFADSVAPERVLDGVLDLRKLPDAVVATTADGVLLVRDMARPERPRAGTLPLVATTLDPRGQVQGLGLDGLLRRHGPSEAPLSEVVLSGDVLAAAAGPAPEGAELATPGAVWAQHADGQVRVHWMGLCRPPAPVVESVPEPEEPTPPEQADAVPGTPTPEGDAQGPPVLDNPEPGPADDSVLVEQSPETEEASVPEAEPAPPPEPFPCAQVLDTGLALAGPERMLQVRAGATGVEVSTTLATHSISAALQYDRQLADWSPAVLAVPGALTDIRNRIVVIDGKPNLAPPTLTGTGARFEIDRGAGPGPSQIGGRLTQTAPLQLPSLQWDRAAKGVRFADGTTLPPAQAIRDGRFLPDAPGRAAYLGGETFALLNPHGLWSVEIGRKATPVSLVPSDLPQDLAAGRFLYVTDGVDARTGARGGDGGRVSVTAGALRVTETLRGGALGATYTVGGADVPAFAAAGFAFDQRQGITAEGGTPLLLTPIGLVPAAGFGPGIPVPSGTAGVDTEGAAALARGPGGWARLSAQGWVASAPPWHDRILAEGQGRRWERRAGTIAIVPLSVADTHAVARRGLDFEADRLVALAADARGIVAILGTGTVDAANFAALASLRPPVAPDPGASALDARDVTPGRSVLWADTAQGLRVWDAAARSWRIAATGEDPWAFRTAVDSGELRFAFRQGQPLASARMQDLGGAARHVGFSWGAGQDMPFDRVRRFVVEGDRILLATELGLRRLSWSGLGSSGLLLYSGVASGTPLTFDRVGRPAADPARLLATAGGACFELASPDAPPAPCARPGSLDERAVASDPLWTWRKTDTEILGTYLDHLGQPLGPARLGAAGRWPHDTLRAVAQCKGTVAELWADADVVARAATGLPGQLQALSGVDALLCQGVTAELGQGARLAPGFLAAGGGSAWRLGAQAWQPENHAAAIQDRAWGDVPWEASRLRLRLDGSRAVQEVRWLDDQWRTIPWQGDGPSIDRITGIAGSGATLRLLTPAGVLDWSAAGRKLDPDTLILRTPDDRGALAGCRPARIEALDGSVQAAAALPGGPVDILCEDGRVWRGDPASTADVGVFGPAVSDIGADRVLVQAGDWVWTRRVATGGATSLSITFRDEAVSLDGGRLSLDDYAGLAAPYRDHVEIVTQGAGWWRHPAGDLSIAAAHRPAPGAGAETATALHSDVVDGAARLCVQGQNAVIVDPSGGVARAPACRDVRGVDTTYTWYTGLGGAAADGVALNGLPLRRNLSGGRFGDLFVTGAPSPDGQGRVLAPTRAGVIVIGSTGPEGTYAKADPTFLVPDATGLPLALGPAGAMPLTGADRPACGALADLPALLPEDARVLRSHRVAPDAVEVLVATQEGKRLPLLVPCAAVQDAVTWSLPLDVTDRGRFRAIGSDVVAARLVASLDRSRLVLADTAGRGVALDFGITGEPLAQVAAPDARAVIVATDRALYRLDTDRALSRIDDFGTTGIPALKGPFAPVEAPPQPAQPQPPAPIVQSPPPAPVPQQPAAPTQPQAPPVPDDTVPLTLTNAEWREVQSALRARGLYSGSLDGIAGPRTLAGLRAWQAQTGRTETGVLTERQRVELIRGVQ